MLCCSPRTSPSFCNKRSRSDRPYIKPSPRSKHLFSSQVQNKTGNLGDSVKVETDDKKVTVKSTIPLSKRYLKYLAKKYLKRNNVNLPRSLQSSPEV